MPAYRRRKTGVEDIVFLDSLIGDYKLNQPIPLTIKAHPKNYEAIYNDRTVILNAIGPNKEAAIANFRLKIIQLYERYKGMEEKKQEIDDDSINEWAFLSRVITKEESD
ncbi:hypothetical protein KY343_00800 [Candidatus Woesearchaeota archaeon]|nr:hypothetical protein [Candidatus Woesearchaeota archaeon]